MATHTHVSCDKSGMSPIVGVRYKKLGENFDLCEAEFAKLPAAERGAYMAVAIPPTRALVVDVMFGIVFHLLD